MLRKMAEYSGALSAYLWHNRGRHDLVQAEMMNDVAKRRCTLALQVPLPPVIDMQATFDYHGKQLYRAINSKLRSRPMQEFLSGNILAKCKGAVGHIPDARLKRGHAGLYCYSISVVILPDGSSDETKEDQMAY